MTSLLKRRVACCLLGFALPQTGLLAQDAAAPVESVIPVQSLGTGSPEPAATEAERKEGPVRLESVTVTAQKKLQFIEDVPISMSVVDSKFIANWAISDMREAMLFVPNVKIEEAGFFASPRVRGFSFNNNNKAFEPPAGIAIDGIPYTRVEYFNSAIFDVKRLEVMRGPQGTTFGKNTTAGLIHILSNDPGNKFQGYVDLQGGELERRRAELALGGPLIGESVQFRLAGFVEGRDGFIHNTTAEVSDQAAPLLRGVDRHGLRAKLRFPDLWGSQFKLAYESVALGSLGAGAELFHASPEIQAVLRRYDPNTDFVKGNYIASIDEPDGRRVDIDTVSGEWTRSFGDWNLVALGGHSVLRSRLDVDTDFSPAPAIFGRDKDRSPSSTIELRAESPKFGGLFGLCSERCGHSSVLAGVYLQQRAIEGSGFQFRIGTVPFLELTVAAEQDEPAQAILDAIPPELASQLFLAIPTNPPGGGGANEEVQQGFEQDAQAAALFGQVAWDFTERWGLELGLRMNWEEKSASWDSHYTQGAPNPILRLAGISEFTAEREISEQQLTPKIALKYLLGEDTHLFLHYARAYKGGGFNAFAFRDMDDELAYGPETAEEWGLDLKSVLLNGRLKANLSFYRQDIDDFQVLTRVPDALTIGLGVTKVENAAKARAQGVEGDLTWLPARWLTVMAAAGYNDTEYLDFKTNDCPADMDNTDGDEDDRCDATGKPFAFAPRLNGTLLSNLRLPLGGSGLEFTLGGAVEYLSKQYLDIDLDERKTQAAFYRYKASIGVGNPRQGWSFRVHGENLSDERTAIRQGDIVPGLFVSLQDPPRTIFGQLRWAF
ncbi:MAG: TonB-dependent receptor [Stagnimonas sp.]|nr:TonB-dependent receptor [Stagnimonas sp.]